MKHYSQANPPIYGANATYKEEPAEDNRINGVVPLDTLPAQWWNWLWNNITKTTVAINNEVKDLFTELSNVLAAANMTPDDVNTNQLASAINKIISDTVPIATNSSVGLVSGGTNYDSVNVLGTGEMNVPPLGNVATLVNTGALKDQGTFSTLAGAIGLLSNRVIGDYPSTANSMLKKYGGTYANSAQPIYQAMNGLANKIFGTDSGLDEFILWMPGYEVPKSIIDLVKTLAQNPNYIWNNMTGDRVLINTQSGDVKKIGTSDTTTTELSYVHGVTSAIQDQLDGKAPTDHSSTTTEYGIATTEKYGHSKLSTLLRRVTPDYGSLSDNFIAKYDFTGLISGQQSGIFLCPWDIAGVYPQASDKAVFILPDSDSAYMYDIIEFREVVTSIPSGTFVAVNADTTAHSGTAAGRITLTWKGKQNRQCWVQSGELSTGYVPLATKGYFLIFLWPYNEDTTHYLEGTRIASQVYSPHDE